MADFETLIVGAGAAGLAAAAALSNERQSICLLEARDRLGGRIFSQYESDFAAPFELGAEFVHGRSPITEKWIQRANSSLIDLADGRWTLQAGKLRPRDAVFFDMKRALDRIPRPKQDLAFGEFLDVNKRTLSPRIRKFARALVEGFDAADADRVSAQQTLDEWRGSAAADAPTFRPLGGYDALVRGLVSALDSSRVAIRRNTIVRAIQWSRHHIIVEAETNGRRIEIAAKRAVITLPLGVLQADGSTPQAVRFSPPLDEKRRALENLAAGPVVKVVLRFRRAFWETIHGARYRDASFFHSPGARFPTVWTALPLRIPLLVVWAGGPNAAQLSLLPDRSIAECAVSDLQTVFGKQARSELVSWHLHNWQTDPFACGAYSFVLAGGARARHLLARPLDDTLFFAGEAADTSGAAATVAGALQSGERAAQLILRALAKS